MFPRLAAILMIVVVLFGCTSESRYGPPSYLKRAPIIGIVANESQQVVDVVSGGAAEDAGVREGDILLDMTWIPDLTPVVLTPLATGTAIPAEGADAASVDGGAILTPPPTTPILDATAVAQITPLPAPTIPPEQYVETSTIPFTEPIRIITLISNGLPLKLRVQRGSETVELTVVPNYVLFRNPTPGENTPTPIPETFYVY